MKNISKGLFLFALLFTFMMASSAFATEKEYLITKTYEYKNERSIKLTKGFVEIMIGQADITRYSNDQYLKITPRPDEIRRSRRIW